MGLVAELDRKELSELGEAYRDKLDVELRPTRTDQAIDWEILLSTAEIRRTMTRRFLQLNALDRAAALVVPIAALFAIGWLFYLSLQAIWR